MRHAALLLAVTLTACGPKPAETVEEPAVETEAPRATVIVEPSETDMSDTVQRLYAAYAANTAPDLARVFTHDLADLYGQRIDAAKGEAVLSFDPVVGAPDWELGEVSFQAAPATRASGLVRARFDNQGVTREVLFDMLYEDGSWRVDNIRSLTGMGYDLRKMLEPPDAPTAPAPSAETATSAQSAPTP